MEPNNNSTGKITSLRADHYNPIHIGGVTTISTVNLAAQYVRKVLYKPNPSLPIYISGGGGPVR